MAAACVTPKVDRDNYTKMLLSLKAYSQVGGLRNMSARQLENMPKEVMIALASDEIALVWNKLPEHMKSDKELLKYQYCNEHYNNENKSDVDEGDGPAPKKLFCCYCKIKDVKITYETAKDGLMHSLNPINCCKQQ